jgi:hypothetical protein
MFNFGEIITGTDDAHKEYRVTTNEATMKVIGLNSRSEIVVELLDHEVDEYKIYVGDRYTVRTKYMRPIEINNRRIVA